MGESGAPGGTFASIGTDLHRLFARALLGLALAVAALAISVGSAAADEGWVIETFDAQIAIQPDGSLEIAETLAVDFRRLKKHGIFRDVPVIYDYDETNNRVYELDVKSVTDREGRSWPYETDWEGSMFRMKIGDPDVTISGPQSYRIAYRVRGALNAFSDHDELYWNVNGEWPVRTNRTIVNVTLPAGGPTEIACFQGLQGSRETCRSTTTARGATFESTRPLGENEQLTIVVGLPKGVVREPVPSLERKPRTFAEVFTVNEFTVGAMVAMLVAVFGGLGWSWWRFGRDRRYASVYYLSDNPAEETRPLLASDPIVVEYEPLDKLRPAQLGLILDERADPLDVTATIVDLAVRGYLRIAEVEREGVFGGIANLLGGRDWELTRTDRATSDLLPYERTIYDGLFDGASAVNLSFLKKRFYTHLSRAQSQLYEDAMRRKWFTLSPDKARSYWLMAGFGIMFLGGGLVALLGLTLGAGLVAVPVTIGGLALIVLANWMPKRTAIGREALRRTLGFRQYVATAETDRQAFSERENLFSEYLPYAIVFGCVDKWARAFEGLESMPNTSYWYVGHSHFHAANFSRDLSGFSSAVSSTIVSTPGSSGGSGFSGGSSGGGGGGGGGGSW